MKYSFDDEFEGSSYECRIFREVFRNDTNSILTKKSLNAGAKTLESDCRKSCEILHYYSENSSIVSQPCPRNEDLVERRLNKRSRVDSAPGCLSGTLVRSNDYNGYAKRLRISTLLKDIRPVLKNHVYRILAAAGWHAEMYKRPSRKSPETIYVSTEGRRIPELARVWRQCMDILVGDRYSYVEEHDAKVWTGYEQFCADLSETMLAVENEIEQSETAYVLAHRWCLLNPFVNVVFGERKIGMMKKGNVVKAATVLLVEKEGTSYELKDGQSHCQIDDGGVLVPPTIKKKDVRPRDSCRAKGKHFNDGTGARTVLSWLINAGVISMNDVIQYRDLNDNTVIKSGTVSLEGIVCNCCKEVLSISEFRVHAGWKLQCPCLNLFMESGKPFSLCELEAWSIEYKTRKSAIQKVKGDLSDPNDGSCGVCGDVGELICCDNCPSAFHQACLFTQETPEGSWYCRNCTCRICANLVNNKEAPNSVDAVKCSQCDHKYHKACMKERRKSEVVSDYLFCSESCVEIFTGLKSRIGLCNLLADGICWTLLRCFKDDDHNMYSAEELALKAECNSKLAVASGILWECFLNMKDATTGIDRIPQVIYNWWSKYVRLDYLRFYTVVLEKHDVLISVASIRIHGFEVAEMPLIATCSSYRRQGMCRRLVIAIEEMLRSFKVEKLVVAAMPSMKEMWTEGFGFTIMDDKEKEDLEKINLMTFPGTVYLKKSFSADKSDIQSGSCKMTSCELNKPLPLCGPESMFEMVQQSSSSRSADIVDAEKQNGVAELDLRESKPSHGADTMKPQAGTEV